MNNIDRENGFAFLELSRKAENNNNNSQREFRSVDRNLLDLIESLEIPTNQMIIQRLLLLNTRRRALHGEVVQNIDSNGQKITKLKKKEGEELLRGHNKEGKLVEKTIGTHLEHTINLVKICETIAQVFPSEWRERFLKKIKTAAILHDIGKTGPMDTSITEQKTFVRLFSFYEPNYEDGRNLSNLTISEAIDRHSLPEEKEEMLASLPGLGLKPDQKMSEVFGKHVDYTYQILRSIPNLDPEIIFIASSHHRSLHNYPYDLTEEQLKSLLPVDEESIEDLETAATILEIADVYEALSSRGEEKSDPKQIIDEMLRLYNRVNSEPEIRHAKRGIDILMRMKSEL